MEKEKSSRRSFLNKLWLGLGVVAAAEAVVFSLAWFRPRPALKQTEEANTVFDLGRADRFTPGSVTAFVGGRFYLVRLEDGGFLALSRTCTHLNCSVPWVEEENRFVCPCHSSAFDIRGDVLDPPAPRAMDLFEVTIEHGQVIVDTARRTRRTAFTPDQATYPVKA